jgi:hypothetical protein
MSSSGSLLRLGGWSFPSSTPPKFDSLVLRRMGGAGIPGAASVPQGEFAKMMESGWKELEPRNE